MDMISISISVILAKSQPLLAILGLSSSVAAVQLATLFAITLSLILVTFGILAFVKSQMALHYNRDNLLLLSHLAIAIATGSTFALLGIPAGVPMIVITLGTIGLSFLIVRLTHSYFFESKAHQHYLVKLQDDSLTLTPDETVAFEAGVEAGKSYKGFFNSWMVGKSYTCYSAYAAGQISEEIHDPIIGKVHKKAKSN